MGRKGVPNLVSKIKQQNAVFKLHKKGMGIHEIHRETGIGIESIASFLGIEDYPRIAPEPSSAKIGSTARIEVLRKRAERGEELFCEGDNCEVDTECNRGKMDWLRKHRFD